MPSLNIYLDKEAYDQVKENPSKIIQKALKLFFKKKKEKKDE